MECVGPGCGIIVSMITAAAEDWVKVVASVHPDDKNRRAYIGWCRRCKEKFEVDA